MTKKPLANPRACDEEFTLALLRLRERAERYAKAFTDSNWTDAYQLTSPRFREICASENWQVLMGAGLKTLKGTVSIAQGQKIEFSLVRVTATGNFGRAHVELRNQGETIDRGLEAEGDRWVFTDGEWWAEAVNWYDGCQWPNF